MTETAVAGSGGAMAEPSQLDFLQELKKLMKEEKKKFEVLVEAVAHVKLQKDTVTNTKVEIKQAVDKAVMTLELYTRSRIRILTKVKEMVTVVEESRAKAAVVEKMAAAAAVEERARVAGWRRLEK